MTVGELIEILELFDGENEVTISLDGIRCHKVNGVDGVRKVRMLDDQKPPKYQEEVFVMIN